MRAGAELGEKKGLGGLTERDLEIFRSFCRGMSYARIAEARGVKPVTIRNAVYAIQCKLSVGSKQEMLVWAVRNGLLDDWRRGVLSRQCRREEPLTQPGRRRQQPHYTLTEPSVGYRMAEGDAPGQGRRDKAESRGRRQRGAPNAE